jgi:hypothetical protein
MCRARARMAAGVVREGLAREGPDACATLTSSDDATAGLHGLGRIGSFFILVLVKEYT